MSFFSGRRQTDDVEHNQKTDAPRPYAQQPIGFESVLGAGADLEGRLSSKGNMRIDGTFTGTLEIDPICGFLIAAGLLQEPTPPASRGTSRGGANYR